MPPAATRAQLLTVFSSGDGSLHAYRFVVMHNSLDAEVVAPSARELFGFLAERLANCSVPHLVSVLPHFVAGARSTVFLVCLLGASTQSA